MAETSGIEEQLRAVEKGLEGVGELLKSTPTRTDYANMEARMDKIEEIAKSADDGIGDLEEELGESSLSELIKSAVSTAVKEATAPLEARIAELEDSPVVKGVNDYGLPGAAPKPQEVPKEIDVMKGIIHTSYPEIDGRN